MDTERQISDNNNNNDTSFFKVWLKQIFYFQIQLVVLLDLI